MMSHTYSGITPNVAYAAVWGNEVFIANATTSGGAKRVIRVQPSKTIIDETAGATHEPHFTTGRWHFGYPNVEKIFTTVAIDTNDLDSVDEITLAYSVDGGAFTSHATTFDGAANTYEWTLSTNSATVQGKDLDLRFTVTDRATTDTDDLRFYRIRARSTSVQARREWQLVLDASDSSSAGHEQNDVAWLQELETLKTAKAVVQFSDPWQQYDEGTADTFDVIVEDVITPAATHSPDDMREAIVVLREIGLV